MLRLPFYWGAHIAEAICTTENKKNNLPYIVVVNCVKLFIEEVFVSHRCDLYLAHDFYWIMRHILYRYYFYRVDKIESNPINKSKLMFCYFIRFVELLFSRWLYLFSITVSTDSVA